MANSYHQIFIHFVFAVKYREAVIKKEWKGLLFAVMGNLVKEMNCYNIIINGVEDHVHCLVRLHPTVAPAKLMQVVKAKSSKWINESDLTPLRFEWQSGYGAFSCSKSHAQALIKYITNQEEHHQSFNFIDEQKRMLTKERIPFNEEYLFQELI